MNCGQARWVVLVGVLLAAGCATGRPVPRAIEGAGDPPGVIRMRVTGGVLVAPARVNGQEAGLFLVDTATAVTVIDADVARGLGVTLGGRADIAGPWEDQEAYTCTLQKLEIGGVALGRHRAHAQQGFSNGFRTEDGRPIVGTLGINGLRQRVFTLDLASHTLTLRDAGYRPAGATAEPLRVERGVLWTPAMIRGAAGGRDVDLWLAIDSGCGLSDAMMLPPETVKRLAGRELNDCRPAMMLARGRDGRMEVVAQQYTVRLPAMSALGQEFRDFDAQCFVPTRRPADYQHPAVLGLQQLKGLRLTFDVQHERVWVEKP